MSEITSITPTPLLTPPLAFMSSVMAKMSTQTCSDSWTLKSTRTLRSTAWKSTATARYAPQV